MRRLQWVRASIALLFAISGLCVSCSLLLHDDATQCRTDADCARFPNAVCNLVTDLCVRRWDSSNTSDAGVTDSGSGGVAGGRGGASGAQGSGGGIGPTGGSTGGSTAMGRPDAGNTSPDGQSTDAHPLGECPDLDHNGVLDCKESLVVNPDFRQSISSWTPELNTAQAFLPVDAEGMPMSGCISITNASQSDTTGLAVGGSWQCVPTLGGASYDYYAEALISIDQGPETAAGIAFQFFTTPNCASPMIGAYAPPLVASGGKGWFLIQGLVPTTTGTLSMAVRLVIQKPLRQLPTQVLFDNVLLKVR